MSGSNTHVAGAGSPRQVRNAFYTGLNINATETSRTAITSGTGGSNGRIAVGDVLIRDPYGHDHGTGTLNGTKNATDFTVPQTSHLHEQALVVVGLLQGKGPQTRGGSTYYPTAFQGVELSEAEQVLVKANITRGSTVLGLVDGQTALGALTGSTLTDNSTGTASATIAAGVGINTVAINLPLVGITGNVDVVTNYTPGYAFKILSVDFVVTKVVSTGGKAATLNLEIGTTNVTGGAVALTSANCTPLGALIAGSAVTANNTGTASDTISVEASSVTAFAEGDGSLLIRLQNMDTANAIASLAAGINNLPKVRGIGLETHDSSLTAAVKPVKLIGPFQVGGL